MRSSFFTPVLKLAQIIARYFKVNLIQLMNFLKAVLKE